VPLAALVIMAMLLSGWVALPRWCNETAGRYRSVNAPGAWGVIRMFAETLQSS
jgi:hypothetical protein